MSNFSKFVKLFSMAGGVRSKTDPVTGGSTFSGVNSSLKLPPGETDLSAGIGGPTLGPYDLGYTESTYTANPIQAYRDVFTALANEGGGRLQLPPVPVSVRADGLMAIMPRGPYQYEVVGYGRHSEITVVPDTVAVNGRFSIFGTGDQATNVKSVALRKQQSAGTGLTLACTFNGSNHLTAATVVDGGTGYYADEGGFGIGCLVTLDGGTPTDDLESNRAQVMVSAVSSHRGPVTTVTVARAGSYSALPANPVAQLSSVGMNQADAYFDEADLTDYVAVRNVWLNGSEPETFYSAVAVPSYEHQLRGIEIGGTKQSLTENCRFRNFLNSALMHNFVGQAHAIRNRFYNVGYRKYTGQPANAIDYIGLGNAHRKYWGLSTAIGNNIALIHDVGIQTALTNVLIQGNTIMGCGNLSVEHQRAYYATSDGPDRVMGDVTLLENHIDGRVDALGLTAPTIQDAVVLEGGNNRITTLSDNYISGSRRRGIASYSPSGGTLKMRGNKLEYLSTDNNGANPPLNVNVERFEIDGGEISNCGSIPLRTGANCKIIRSARPMKIIGAGAGNVSVAIQPSSTTTAMDIALDIESPVNTPYNIGVTSSGGILKNIKIRGSIKNATATGAAVQIIDRVASSAVPVDSLDVSGITLENTAFTSLTAFSNAGSGGSVVGIDGKTATQVKVLSTYRQLSIVSGAKMHYPMYAASLSADFSSAALWSTASTTAIADAAAQAVWTDVFTNYDSTEFVAREGWLMTDAAHAAGAGIISLSAASLGCMNVSGANTFVAQLGRLNDITATSFAIFHAKQNASNRVSLELSKTNNVLNLSAAYRVGGVTATIPVIAGVDITDSVTVVVAWDATNIHVAAGGQVITVAHGLGFVPSISSVSLGYDTSNNGRALNGVMKGWSIIPSNVGEIRARAISLCK